MRHNAGTLRLLAAELAKELEKRLPDQGRKELRDMIEHNLRMKDLSRKKTSAK